MTQKTLKLKTKWLHDSLVQNKWVMHPTLTTTQDRWVLHPTLPCPKEMNSSTLLKLLEFMYYSDNLIAKSIVSGPYYGVYLTIKEKWGAETKIGMDGDEKYEKVQGGNGCKEE